MQKGPFLKCMLGIGHSQILSPLGWRWGLIWSTWWEIGPGRCRGRLPAVWVSEALPGHLKLSQLPCAGSLSRPPQNPFLHPEKVPGLR